MLQFSQLGQQNKNKEQYTQYILSNLSYFAQLKCVLKQTTYCSQHTLK